MNANTSTTSNDRIETYEDFEYQSLVPYAGDADGFDFETGSALQGNGSLVGTATGATIATDHISTPRGVEYLCAVSPSEGSYQNVLFHVQDVSAPMDANYALWFGEKHGDLALQERVGGERTDIVASDYDFTAGETYIVGFASTENGVWGSLYDSDLQRLARTPLMASTEHVGGSLGFGVGPATGVRFDQLMSRPVRGRPPEQSQGDSGGSGDSGSDDGSSDGDGSDGSDGSGGGSDGSGESNRTPIESAADLDETTTGPGQGPRPDLSGRKPVSVSEAGGLAAAAEQAANGAEGTYVELDTTAELTESYVWPNGVDLVGDGKIVAATHEGKILIPSVKDAWFDGIEYDGAREVNRLFQALDADGIRRLRITNCELHGSEFNLISIAEDDSRSDQEVSKDISLLGNEMYDADGHGAFIGHARGDSGGAGFKRVVMERNHVHDMSGRDDSMGMFLTVYGKPQAPTTNCSISENYGHDGGWDGFVLEDSVYDSKMERNRVLRTNKGGLKVSGDARRNEITDNITVGGRSGLEAAGQHPHAGDPTENVFSGNIVRKVSQAIQCIEAGPDNEWRENAFSEYDVRVNDRDAEPQIIEDNQWE
jgi:uncharacterized membrane protein YgcG